MATHTRLSLLTKPAPQEALQEAVDSFLRRGQARSLSASTLRFYRDRLGAFIRYLDSHGLRLAPEQVTAQVVRDFLTAEAERVSAATANHSRAALSAFFRFLVSDEVIPSDPMTKVEKVRLRQRVIPTLRQEEIERMLATCSPRTFNGARLKAVILTLVDCGLRVSELCGLDLGDVARDAQTLRVMGKGSKERLVPFGEATRQALLAYMARRGELAGQPSLFVTCYGERLNRTEAHRLLRECGERAGVSGVHPHRFRHTCAVMYLRNGGDAFSLQKLLGHSSLDMTRRYAELAQADVVAKHRQCSPGDRFLGAVRVTGGRKRLK